MWADYPAALSNLGKQLFLPCATPRGDGIVP